MSQPGAASVSSGSGSARSWSVLGHAVGTQDADWILSLVQKMNRHEVPSCYSSLANNIIKGLRNGSIVFGKTPTCQPSTNLSEFIAKQVLCRSGLYLKHEPNVKTLLLDTRMMVSPMKLTVPSAAPIQLSLSAYPDHLKTERSVNNLRPCGENCQISSKFSSLMEMTKVHLSSQRSKTRSQVLSIKDRRNGIGKLVFKRASLGSGQTFTLVSPDLSVPGVSPDVLQRVLSQANSAKV